MRRRTKLRYRIFLLLLAVCMIPAIQVNADWKDAGREISCESFFLGESEEEIAAKAESEDGVLHLTVDTADKNEGYYAVSFFKNMKIDGNTDPFAGIALTVKNNCSKPVNMNVICVNKDGTALVVGDGTDVIFRTGGTYIGGQVENGSMVIPEAYEGEVYLPFQCLVLSKGTGTAELEGIWGIGLTLVIPEESAADIEISRIFLTQCTEAAENQIAYLLLRGDDSVLKPTVGESVVQYHAAAYNIAGQELDSADVRYEISECEGAAIDENSGLLCMDKNAEQDVITVRAIAGDGAVAEKNVEVKASWTTTQKTDNGYDASLAAPDEVADIQENIYFLMDDRLIWAVRIIAVSAGIVLMIYYRYHRRRRAK